MNETTIDLDLTDEEILTHDVADEALEAAAGTVQGGRSNGVYSACTAFPGGERSICC